MSKPLQVEIIKRPKPNPRATLMFFRWGFPVILIIGGWANFNEGQIYRTLTWVGVGWLFLSFLPIIIKLIKKFR